MPFPLSEADMAAAEAALGVRFPAAYREKMLDDNGGEVEVEDDDFHLFAVLDRTDRTRLARTSANDIVRENESARAWPGFPPDAVAIGTNGGGDYLVFVRDGEGLHPAVLRWDHETGVLDAVAEGFAELFDDAAASRP